MRPMNFPRRNEQRQVDAKKRASVRSGNGSPEELATYKASLADRNARFPNRK